MLGLCLRQLKNGVSLSLLLAPNAKRSAIVGIFDGQLKIAVRAPAQEGKANAALIQFLAKVLAVPKSSIELVKGHTSKRKLVVIGGLPRKTVETKLTVLLQTSNG